MALSNEAKGFIGNFQRRFNDLAGTIVLLESDAVLYTKRSYSALSDADWQEANSELTAAKVGAGINLIAQLEKLLGAAATTPDDWQAALDQIRTLN